MKLADWLTVLLRVPRGKAARQAQGPAGRPVRLARPSEPRAETITSLLVRTLTGGDVGVGGNVGASSVRAIALVPFSWPCCELVLHRRIEPFVSYQRKKPFSETARCLREGLGDLDPDDGVGLHGVRTSRVRRDWRDDAPFEPLVALLGRRLIGHRELGRTRAAVAPRRGPSASSSGPPATHASTPASLCRRDG